MFNRILEAFVDRANNFTGLGIVAVVSNDDFIFRVPKSSSYGLEAILELLSSLVG